MRRREPRVSPAILGKHSEHRQAAFHSPAGSRRPTGASTAYAALRRSIARPRRDLHAAGRTSDSHRAAGRPAEQRVMEGAQCRVHGPSNSGLQ